MNCCIGLLILMTAFFAEQEKTISPTNKELPGNPQIWSRTPETMKKIRSAVNQGLAYLAQKQEEGLDGSISKGDAKQYAPVGITALTALAFMGSGNASYGPFSKNALRAVDYLVANCNLSGGENHGYIFADNDPHSKMHGHGYATLALAEAYGMYGAKRGKEYQDKLRQCIGAAVALIEKSQGETGGWYYTPYRNIAHEGSVTITMVQALRAARNVGFRVNKSVIERAIQYIKALQKDDGSFRYQLGREDSTAALTAAAISTLNAGGVYAGPESAKGLDFLLRSTKRSLFTELKHIEEPFPVYRRLYTAQAFYQYKDPKLWQQWFGETWEQLLAEQRDDGSWRARTEFGSIYPTAVNCLVLEISFDYLPIFQR